MSGGRYNYFYRDDLRRWEASDIAATLVRLGCEDASRKVAELAGHLEAAEKIRAETEDVLRAVEWYACGDYSSETAVQVVEEWRKKRAGFFPYSLSTRSSGTVESLRRGWSTNAAEPLLRRGDIAWTSEEWRMWADWMVPEGRSFSVYQLVDRPCRAVSLGVCRPEEWSITFTQSPVAHFVPGDVVRIDGSRTGRGADAFYCTLWMEPGGDHA
ncbi:MAG: hypothetical protein QUS11_04130 [Candidatus Fermentibacter sp.]|nr:hypothetical protein [Candidatus Fermentibacter sp.]